MSLFEKLKRRFLGNRAVTGIVLLLLGGLVWQVVGTRGGLSPARQVVHTAQGVFYGEMPNPAEPSIGGAVREAVAPEKRFRLMTIKHIPRIAAVDPMPHPFVGQCNNCHLYRGGPGPGNQFKTPIGAALEHLSKIRKLGPPLIPNSEMPHPPAGRCIKCHDVVIKVPVERKKGGFRWIM